MADTPYREAPEVAPPRPPRRDPLAEEAENPPHVRAAGAILVANALLGLALGAAQVRAGMPANLGLLTFAAVVDIPIGAGLWKRSPTLVRPVGLRRFAVLRLVCGIAVALLAARGAPEGAALSVCASLAPLALLSRERSPWRVRTAAVAQALVVLAGVWFMVWLERGQRLFWGALQHARGEVGAAVRGRVGGGSRRFSLEVPSGWYASREAGAQGDLHLVAPEWDGELQVTAVARDGDDGAPAQDAFVRGWMEALDGRDVPHDDPAPYDLADAAAAARVRVGSGRSAVWLFGAVKRDGDALVTAEVAVPEGYVRANPGAVRDLLRSLHAEGRSPAEVARGPDAPVVAVPGGRLALGTSGWSLPVTPGWWTLAPALRRSLLGDDVEGRVLTAPFERSAAAVWASPDVDVLALERALRMTPGAVTVTPGPLHAIEGATEYVARDGDERPLGSVLIAPREGAFVVAQVFGAPMPPRRRAELLAMLRAAGPAAPPP